MDNPISVSATTRGRRSGTIIPIPDDQCNEIYNIPSDRRQTLLTELGEVLQIKNIPVPFWAGLQVCDLDILEKMVEKARVAPEFIWVVAKYSCRHLPLLWLQKPPRNDVSTSTSSSIISSVDSNERPTKKARREHKIVELAKKREKHGCFLRHTEPTEAAHIYPNYLIYPHAKHTQKSFEFWDLLKIFWGPEKLARWRAPLYRNLEDPTKAADTIKNLICMGLEVHKMWDCAKFALRPLEQNDQKTEFLLEWHWLPKESHNFNDDVEIRKVPYPTMNLDCTMGEHNPFQVLMETEPNTFRKVKTGERITMTTSNPEKMPLPDYELLDLQFHLQRLSAMAAAAEVDKEDEDEDDQHRPMAGTQGVEEWLDSLDEPNPVQKKLESKIVSSSSSRSWATDTDASNNPDFSSTARSVPSLLKASAMGNLSVEKPSYLLERNSEGWSLHFRNACV